MKSQFVGTVSSIEQAIGNAVPVRMAEYVAKVIMSTARGDAADRAK